MLGPLMAVPAAHRGARGRGLLNAHSHISGHAPPFLLMLRTARTGRTVLSQRPAGGTAPKRPEQARRGSGAPLPFSGARRRPPWCLPGLSAAAWGQAEPLPLEARPPPLGGSSRWGLCSGRRLVAGILWGDDLNQRQQAAEEAARAGWVRVHQVGHAVCGGEELQAPDPSAAC